MKNHNQPWSDYEKQYLKDNYRVKGYAAIAEDLGRTPDAVRRYLQRKEDRVALGRKPTIHREKPPEPPKERKKRMKFEPPPKQPMIRPPAIYNNKGGYLSTLEKYS